MNCFVYLTAVCGKYRRSVDIRHKAIQFIQPAPFKIILSDWDRWKGMIAKGGVSLPSMIGMTGGFQCQKRRDKIYGMLGMCTALDRQIIEVDYTDALSDRTLMIKATVYFLTLYSKFGCLNILQRNQEAKSIELPSWTPDYFVDDPQAHFIFPATEECLPYRASANNAAWSALSLVLGVPDVDPTLNSVELQFEYAGSDVVLVLPGLLVDTISVVRPSPNISPYQGHDLSEDAVTKECRRLETMSACKSWEDEALKTPRVSRDPYKSTCGRYEAFWRTLIADRDSSWRGPPTADWGRLYEAWKQAKGAEKPYTQPFSDATIIRCSGRSFVMTSEGFFGLAPYQTRPGDLVCVLRGGNVPFVLRQRGDSCYEFVGEAYVHGIMDGNFVRGATSPMLREFRIR
ncbi:hypothetical protein MMC28_006741 [Mycoblastus sanguinarius]|nr:hypothetical protein [Mycoblastus sanguinarius]